MNVTKKFGTNETNNGEIMVMVPLSLLNTIDRKQDKLLKLLKSENSNAPALKEYLSEEEARTMLKKGKTWFFNMRSEGKLTGLKVGGTRYYKLTEIEYLFSEDVHNTQDPERV